MSARAVPVSFFFCLNPTMETLEEYVKSVEID